MKMNSVVVELTCVDTDMENPAGEFFKILGLGCILLAHTITSSSPHLLAVVGLRLSSAHSVAAYKT
jgi:hypothetical protein